MFLDLLIELATSWWGFTLYIITTILVVNAMVTDISDYRMLKLGIVEAIKESYGNGVFSFQFLLTFILIWWTLAGIRYDDAPDAYYFGIFVLGLVLLVILTAVLPGVVLMLKHKITFRGLACMSDVDMFLALRKHIRSCGDDTSKICRNCGKTYNPNDINSLVAKHIRHYAIKWSKRKQGLPIVLSYFYASYYNRCCSPKCEASHLEKQKKEIKDREHEYNRLHSLRKVHELTDEEYRKLRLEWDNAHKKCGNCVHDVDNQCVLKAVTDTGYPAVLDDTRGCSEGFKLKPNARVPKKTESRYFTIDERGLKTEVSDLYRVD